MSGARWDKAIRELAAAKTYWERLALMRERLVPLLDAVDRIRTQKTIREEDDAIHDAIKILEDSWLTK